VSLQEQNKSLEVQEKIVARRGKTVGETSQQVKDFAFSNAETHDGGQGNASWQ